MIKTPSLERLCREISVYPPNWEILMMKCRMDPRFGRANLQTTTKYAQFFSETYLDMCVMELSHRFPQFHIDLRPIEDESISRPNGLILTGEKPSIWRYRYINDGRILANTIDGWDYEQYEYDKIITMITPELGLMPVVFEIKIGDWRASIVGRTQRRGKIRYRKGRKIRNSLRPEIYNRKLGPIQQYFRCDVGYVMIIPRNMFENRERDKSHKTSTYNQFKMNNGILVPFYAGRHKFREEVSYMIKKEGLPLQE